MNDRVRAVSLVEVAEPSVWAELAAVVSLDGHLGPVVSPTCREALRSFHDTVVPALTAAGVPVLLRDARRTRETVEVARQTRGEAVARLSRAAATVLRQAQRHGLDAGLPAWDPESDAAAVRELLGAELVVRDDDERHHLASDLPPPPALEIDVTEAIMPPTDDLPAPRPGPIALLHDLASLAAAIDHSTPSRTHAGTVARADVRRMAVRLATEELRRGGSLEGDPRWGRALRALEVLGAVSLDPIDRTLHLDLGLDDTLLGDTAEAVDRFVLRLVDADLRPAVAVVRATLHRAGDQAIDELVWMELLRDQQRALLFVPWHRDGREVYPGTEVPFDDGAFERIEAGQLRRLLERLEVLGVVRRAPGVFAATPDGVRWAGAAVLPPPPVWVSSDLQVIVPPDGVTPWERFQLERLGRCIRRDVVDVYVLERAGLAAWLRWHDLSEALALLARRAPAVPAAVVEALTTWARQASRIVVTRGVLLVALLAVVAAGCMKKREASAAAPVDLARAELPCRFVPGAVHRYRIERTTEDDDGGETSEVLRYAYDLRIEVVSYERNKSVVAVGGNTGPPEIFESDPITRSLLEAIHEATVDRDLTAVYTTDHDTGLHTVENLDDLVRAYGPVATLAAEAFRRRVPDATDDQLSLFGELDDPDFVLSIVEADASIPLDFGCTTFPVLPTNYDTDLPGAFGMADSFAGTGRVWATEEEPGTWVVRKAEEADPAGTNRVLRAYLEDTWEDDANIDTMSLDVRGEVEVAVPVALGWPTGWTIGSTATITSSEDAEPLERRANTIVGTRLPDQSD